MADAVKQALEAATEAVMDAMGWKDDGMQDFEPEPTARDAARDAIVAFLRALPEGYVEIEREHKGIIFPQQLGMTDQHAKLLAASVARAGEEGCGG